ncbi:hypothetical protein COV18_05465 [Candidatus Woesearchaeota archaeon CG10_big_fil_rev_8_21_14_0_10_37_12]|nr:MAG: hypothetical protein COV18_05465 [Candidatus Woesearchaeota archaeon CG10_big_fil_rev_8_21_14_0_10_37_12]
MTDEQLVEQFVDEHAKIEQLLEEEKIKEAKQTYLDLLETYKQIQQSKLEQYHKELAYDQLNDIFQDVNRAKERVQIPYNLVIAGVLVLALGMLVAFNPTIVGFASLHDEISQPVDLFIDRSGIHQITLKDKPLTLKATGTFNGAGKLFLKQGETFHLIVDSSTLLDGNFENACDETCEVNHGSNNIELFAELEEGSTLTVGSLLYKIPRTDNSAPVWSGSTTQFSAQQGQTLTLNLNEHFSDSDGDPLVYLSTTEAGLQVTVQNEKVLITPQSGITGAKQIIFIASDLEMLTKVPVTINVG